MEDLFSPGPRRYGFAYLFERFPSSTRTFSQREVLAMQRLGMNPLILSIREPEDPPDEVPASLSKVLYNLPSAAEVTASGRRALAAGDLPSSIAAVLREKKRPDKHRLFEALHLGPRLRQAGIGHVHAHFGGMAARTAYWIERVFGIPYSFTGHANDIFCETDLALTRAELVRAASFVVTVAGFSQRWLQERHPAAASRVHRIYNGIDLDEYRSADPSQAGREIVSVGRLIEKKGFSVLVEACELLARAGERFHCTIIGSGPLEGDLRNLIGERGLQEQVTLAGHQQEPAVRAALEKARLFALPCVSEAGGGMDTLPTVIVEAMATGLPVVSTPIAGVPEMVDDMRTGFIVPEGDAAALAETMRKLLADPDLARTMGEAGRRKAETTFDAGAMARQLARLLLSRGSASLPTSASGDRELLQGYRRQRYSLKERWRRLRNRWNRLRGRSL